MATADIPAGRPATCRCPQTLSTADDETEPGSVVRCTECGKPVGTYYPATTDGPVLL